MKKKPASQSAFFNPRVVIGFVLFSIGLLVALAALSKSVTGMVRHEMTVQTSGSWTSTGSLNVGRRGGFTATLLSNGKVLLTGGCIENPDDPYCNGSATTGAELYDPSSGNWTPTGSMLTPRQGHTATLLADGRVLVAGGQLQACLSNSSAELYDPNTGQWTATGSMNSPRSRHFATLITSGSLQGKVLAGGGYINQNDGGCGGTAQLATAELYDPATGLWAPTSDLIKARDYPIASALPDGSVLVLGTLNCCPYHWFNSAESYNPDTGLWTPTSSRTTAANGVETGLPDGKIIVVGGTKGTQPTSVNVPDAELFDPATGGWTGTADMSTDRAGHSLTLLGNGQVLVAGGFSGGWGVCNDLKSAELYDPNSGTWSVTRNMTIARNSHTATLLPSGQVLVAGGTDCAARILSSAELYTPATTNEECVPPPAGLVSWWAGDGNPEDLYDLNDLTAQNGATFGPGKVSQALSLDGVDDYFTVANNGSLNPGTSDFTFEFWINTRQTTDAHILAKRSGCGLSSFYVVSIHSYGGITLEMAQDNTANNYNVVDSFVPVNDGAWHHVAAVREGVTGSVYIDGVLSASASTPGITNISNNRQLTIGTSSCRVQFGGLVDELTYYNSALPASTIAAIYAAGSSGKCKASSFVQSINPTWAPIGNLKKVTNTTTAVDANGFPVNYATVVIKVTDPTGAITAYTSTTDEGGQATCSFLTSQSGTFKFAINRIFKTAITYDASMNIQSRARLILP